MVADENARNSVWSGLMSRHVLDLGNAKPGTFMLGEMGMAWNSDLQSFAAIKGQPYELQLTTPDLVGFFKRRHGK